LPDIEEVVDFPPLGPTTYEPAGYGASGGSTFEQGTSITSSSSANTKGSWTQLIASTTYKVVGIMVYLEYNGAAILMVDIGTGASGSEAALIPDIFVDFESSTGPQTVGIFFPVQIPVGTRIAARCQATAASKSVFVSLSLIEAP